MASIKRIELAKVILGENNKKLSNDALMELLQRLICEKFNSDENQIIDSDITVQLKADLLKVVKYVKKKYKETNYHKDKFFVKAAEWLKEEFILPENFIKYIISETQTTSSKLMIFKSNYFRSYKYVFSTFIPFQVYLVLLNALHTKALKN